MSSGSKVSRPELFAAASPSQRRQFVASLEQEERNQWEEDFLNSAHPGQLPPEGDWLTWLVMGGRGFGKTRAGAEWVRRIAEGDGRARIALVAASMAEARSVMIEGESGLIACSPEHNRPVFEPSLHRLRWSNGAHAFLYSAAEPESLRGPQHSHASRSGAEGVFRQRSACPARCTGSYTCPRHSRHSACQPGRRRCVAGPARRPGGLERT